jgi:CubicO group peptidase (beta-lactamase class C family)
LPSRVHATRNYALLLVPLALVASIHASLRWPTASWPESSPEAQGVSSGDLAEALEVAHARQLNIHNLIVVRNGVIILDANFYPFTPRMRHDVASVTKSIMSVLVGIAVDEKHFTSVDELVSAALPTTQLDSHEAALTIGHLLAMQSGFDCGFKRGEPELAEMRRSTNWVRFALQLPSLAPPGTRFGYCSPNYHVLSAALSAATHVSALEFARRHLFQPLGIHDVYWPADPMGISHGWGDLQLRPRDMAKIGLLMLEGGQWEDRRLISKSGVESAAAVHAQVNANEDYGFGWWISRRVSTLFEANGRGGQRISVVPEKRVVVVMTGGGFEPGDLGGYLLTAMRSDVALPENPDAGKRLAVALRAIGTPPAPRIVAGSVHATQVSGRVYALDANPIGIDSFAVEFSSARHAVLRLHVVDGTALTQPLGLDGQYRIIVDDSGAASAGRGEWLPDGRFRAELNRLTRINRFTFDIDFRDDEIAINASEPTQFGTVTLRGRLQARAR